MKTIILSLLILISFKSFSQSSVDSNGNVIAKTVVIMHSPLKSTVRLDSLGKPKDSVDNYLGYSTADFKQDGNNNLALVNQPQPPSTSDYYQLQTAATGQTVFTFVNLPANIWDIQVFKNGVKLKNSLFTKSGNVITIPSMKLGYYVEVYILRK